MNTSSSNAESPALFVTQAKGIQDYVLGTDKLRDMVGATELVERLSGEILQKTLENLGLHPGEDYRILSVAAGTARVRFQRRKDALSLAAIWPLVCAHATPELEVYQTVQSFDGGNFLQAISEAERALALARGLRDPNLPVAGPPIGRSQRTGGAAVGKADASGGEREDVDAATFAKRSCRDKIKDSSLPDIFRRMGFEPDGSNKVPDDFDHISGRDRDYLALIHADGNGLGQLFIRLEEHFRNNSGLSSEKIEGFYSAISKAIAKIAQESASEARQAIKPQWDSKTRWPVMPFVLAGDDFTLVTRADLALLFVEVYLEKFEEISRAEIVHLLADYSDLRLEAILPEALSAGAGIVFMKPGFPFSTAYKLCESLAKHAKSAAKKLLDPLGGGRVPAPSSLAFHKITASTIQVEYAQLLENELSGAAYRPGEAEGSEDQKNPRLRLTMAPYYVGPTMPSLQKLNQLVNALEKFPKGPPRELYSLLQTDSVRAKKHYERMLAVNEESGKILRPALQALVQTDNCCTSGSLQPDTPPCTPIGDALTLLGFRRKKDDSKK